MVISLTIHNKFFFFCSFPLFLFSLCGIAENRNNKCTIWRINCSLTIIFYVTFLSRLSSLFRRNFLGEGQERIDSFCGNDFLINYFFSLFPRQVKLEESGEEQIVYSSQPASHTESPVPPRSDSGCEVLPGPYTPSQSPLLPRLHPHTHSPTHLYSPTQSPGPSRHVSGFSSPYR